MKRLNIQDRMRFTLIELLVVIAIIAILAAMLMPALESARNAALTAQCQNKLRNLGQGMYYYAADYDEQVPKPGWSDPNGDNNAQGWPFRLPPYLGGAYYTSNFTGLPTFQPREHGLDVQEENLRFYCNIYESVPDVNGAYPLESGGHATWARAHTSYPAIGSYQLNPWLDFYGVSTHNNRNWQLPRPRARLSKMHSGTMLMGEVWKHWGPYYNPNHRDKSSLLFADNHTELREPSEIPPNAAHTWTMDVSNMSEDKKEFWGFYLMKYYENPGSYNWW